MENDKEENNKLKITPKSLNFGVKPTPPSTIEAKNPPPSNNKKESTIQTTTYSVVACVPTPNTPPYEFDFLLKSPTAHSVLDSDEEEDDRKMAAVPTPKSKQKNDHINYSQNISPIKKAKLFQTNNVRSSPRIAHQQLEIIGPLASPPGKSTRSQPHIQKFFNKRNTITNSKTKNKTKTNRVRYVEPRQSAEEIAVARRLAQEAAAAAAVLSEAGRRNIAQEKAMVILTKRTSNHHAFSQIWQLDIARDADLTPTVKDLFKVAGKFYYQKKYYFT
jgi:hypothetical protein